MLEKLSYMDSHLHSFKDLSNWIIRKTKMNKVYYVSVVVMDVEDWVCKEDHP
jgi:hypothetical protein